MERDQLILAKNHYYSLDCHQTKRNNNVLVVGTSGAGKTRSIVTPNLLQASGSYIVSDPKGNLYSLYKDFLERHGYVVKKLDFTDPRDSAHYNFFHYIRSSQDIVKVAHMLCAREKNAVRSMDPFWDEANNLLLQALIAYLVEEWSPEEQTLHNALKLAELCMPTRNSGWQRTKRCVRF